MSKGGIVDASKESEAQINKATTACFKHLATTFTRPKACP